ncbi:MAG: ferritin-like domain-containing protein [Gemmatimonadota bacterium]|nr:ferritin-like domain-containing protein [Gemmatimonadota bacterium]
MSNNSSGYSSIASDSNFPRRLIGAADPELADRMAERHEALLAGAPTNSGVRMGLAMGSAAIATAAVASDLFGQGSALPGIVVDVLNFALTLEHLEAEFYVTGVGTSGLIPADVMPVFDQIRKHEVAHVALLKSVLGGRQAAKPQFDYTGGAGSMRGPFADVFTNFQTFAAVSQAFEDTGVRAYKGQAANLMGSPEILETALKIHSVEARHASEVRRIRQQKGWITRDSRGNLPPQTQGVYEGEGNTFHFILARPGSGLSMSEAFDEPLTKAKVLDIVAPFIASH